MKKLIVIAAIAINLSAAALAADTATSVVAGYSHTCALTTDGGVKCWGSNTTYGGELGDGTTTQRLTPVDVVGLSSGVNAIAAGWYHTCAVTNIGGVKCWGTNNAGQLGDGTTTQRLTPVDVIGLSSGVATIATGAYRTCAVTSVGGVKCWGEGNGQLPVDVVGLSSEVSAIAPGLMHTCALTTSGGVKCWGNNAFGQLGDGTKTHRSTPGDVLGLTSGVTAIVANDNRTCVLTDLGGMKCWGYNGSGQLGDGTITNRTTPVDVVGLSSGVSTIAAGISHTCAVTSAGAAKCWGHNNFGQLGDGTQEQKLTPVSVVGLTSGVGMLAGGSYHTCAVTNVGSVKCWGNGDKGQRGDNSTTIVRTTPINVGGFSGNSDSDGDGIIDDSDNCQSVSNPTQTNFDGDTQGDACDADDDNDGAPDVSDVFPFNPAEWLDTDNDGTGNNADTDDDNDGVLDVNDKFPFDAAKSKFIRHDAEADGDSDVLVRSASTGVWSRYRVQNSAIVGSSVTYAPASNDSVYVAQLDANGDGDADILTRSASTGAWTLSFVDSGGGTSFVPLYLYASLAYQFVGTGDFNNDGTDDVMLRHATQGYRVFLLQNHAVSSVVLYNAWVDASSVDQGIGDFNGDGTDDLLVRRTSDNLYFIFKTINGAVSNYYCACNIWSNTAWTFQFAGDTNKDGKDDIVIRGTGPTADGKWWAFRMNNFSSSAYSNLNLFINKTAITVGAVGDYNGDGTIDVLTRVNNSTTYVSPIVNGVVTGNYWLYNFTTDQVIGK